MPYCAACGWHYGGTPRFCRECGRSLYRSHPAPPGVVALQARPETRVELWRRRLIIGALGVLAGAAMLDTGLAGAAVALSGFPTDESWARLVYARSLAQDLSLSFAPAQPAAGVGSPLWVAVMSILIATFGALGVSVVALAKTGSLLAAGVAAVLAAELGERLTSSRLAGIAAGLLTALHPTFAFGAAAGLEVPLFAALALGCCLCVVLSRPIHASVLLGLALLARPEALALIVALGIVLAPAGALAGLSSASGALARARAMRPPRLPRAEPERPPETPPSDQDTTIASSASTDDLSSLDDIPDVPDVDEVEEEPEPEAAEAPDTTVAPEPPTNVTPREPIIQRLRQAIPDRAALLRGLAISTPIILALTIWVVLDRSAGSIWPQGLRVARALRGGVPAPDLPALWSGYLAPSTGYLGGLWPMGLAVLVLGGVGLARVPDRKGLPVLAFPLLLLLGVSAIAPLEHVRWGFETRRLLDPVLPFLAVLFIVGLSVLWREGLRIVGRRQDESPHRMSGLVLAAAGMAAAIFPVAAITNGWSVLPAEYARSAAISSETTFALGRYIRDSLPAEATVAALQPGALAYVGRRPTADLRGVHTPSLAGLPPAEALLASKAEYAAVPRSAPFESLPGATLIREIVPRPTLGQVGTLALFRMTPPPPHAPRDAVYALPSNLLRRLDFLDVGNEASERSHAYSTVGFRAVTRRALKITPQQSVDDDGRSVVGAEQFDVIADPGHDVLIARRFDSANPGVFRVTFDGQPVGEWRPRAGRFAIAEDAIRIPAGFVRRLRSTVRLELVPAGARATTTYAYWSFVDAEPPR